MKRREISRCARNDGRALWRLADSRGQCEDRPLQEFEEREIVRTWGRAVLDPYEEGRGYKVGWRLVEEESSSGEPWESGMVARMRVPEESEAMIMLP